MDKETVERISRIATKYEQPDQEKLNCRTVTIPKEITDRLEELRDTTDELKYLPIWAIISGITESFIGEYESKDEQQYYDI